MFVYEMSMNDTKYFLLASVEFPNLLRIFFSVVAFPPSVIQLQMKGWDREGEHVLI